VKGFGLLFLPQLDKNFQNQNKTNFAEEWEGGTNTKQTPLTHAQAAHAHPDAIRRLSHCDAARPASLFRDSICQRLRTEARIPGDRAVGRPSCPGRLPLVSAPRVDGTGPSPHPWTCRAVRSFRSDPARTHAHMLRFILLRLQRPFPDKQVIELLVSSCAPTPAQLQAKYAANNFRPWPLQSADRLDA
jgi:hypothetical protein